MTDVISGFFTFYFLWFSKHYLGENLTGESKYLQHITRNFFFFPT